MCVLKTVYQTEASALRNIVRHQIVTAHAGDVDGSGSAFGAGAIPSFRYT